MDITCGSCDLIEMVHPWTHPSVQKHQNARAVFCTTKKEKDVLKVKSFGQDKVEPFRSVSYFSLYKSLENNGEECLCFKPQKNKRSSSRAFSSKFQGHSPKHDIHLQVILCLNQNSNRLPKTSSKSSP